MINSPSLIPTVAPASSVSFAVASNGLDLGPSLPVLSIVVDQEVNRIPSATLILEDGSLAAQTFALSESGHFDPGSEINIQLGYTGTNETVFKGIVVGQSIKLRADKTLLVVTCKGASYRMAIKRQTRYFEDQSDADAWQVLLDAAGLTGDFSGGDRIVPELTQHLCTDWDFMVSRAEANGLVVIAKNGEVQILKPELAATAALQLAYGANLMSFDAEVDNRHQFVEVESYGWSAADDEVMKEDAGVNLSLGDAYSTAALADSHDLSPLKQVQGGGVEAAELSGWSTATSRFSALSRVRGTMVFQGTSSVTVGDTVELDKMGAVYNGQAYISGIRHELRAGQWTTTAQLGLSPERHTEKYAVSAPPAAGLLPAVSGLHIATVLNVHEDPMGEERIQITLPATAPEGAGNWARLAAGVGGTEAGLTFRPAVNDEVVVGFLHADPRYPVILGGLHSSSHPSPLAPTEDNEQTGYVSRGGHRFVFDDNEKTIELTTMSGDLLRLNGNDGEIKLEDQHGNTITMSSSGISIESATDLNLKATGKVAIEGAGLEMKSSTTAKLEGSAMLTLKGGMVQIN
ncbi:type VI secretion system tip protein VgrG [Neolewinella persica]|uniref:type VI secretion system tip protein VgrG n=1 Tax=Neolewinella persica TaxID=70998 RepID=UPI00038052C3|nr:type VI secretion system tip protein VgrG [Neolewinella persica]